MNFSAEEYTRQVQEAAAYIKEKLGGRAPEIAITLGSGLGDLADHLVDAVQIPYGEIPHFPVSTVAGHKGQFVVGQNNPCGLLMIREYTALYPLSVTADGHKRRAQLVGRVLEKCRLLPV